jgi:hypothetical protein
MARHPLFPVSTNIVAARNFSMIEEGAPGVMTGTADVAFFLWTRRYYLGTFADDLRITAPPEDIDAFDHRISVAALEAREEMPPFSELYEQVLKDDMQKWCDALIKKAATERPPGTVMWWSVACIGGAVAAIAGLLVVSGCATVHDTYAPDGRRAYSLNCSGPCPWLGQVPGGGWRALRFGRI